MVIPLKDLNSFTQSHCYVITVNCALHSTGHLCLYSLEIKYLISRKIVQSVWFGCVAFFPSIIFVKKVPVLSYTYNSYMHDPDFA